MTIDLIAQRSVQDRDDFRNTVQAMLLQLPESSAREAWLVDEELSDWPLNEPAVLQALALWLRQPGRRLNLLARGFEALALGAPRLAHWRRDWSHAVFCSSPAPSEVPALPCLAVVAPVCVEIFDRRHWRGALRPGAAAVHQAMVQIDAISQRSAPSWPLHLLGL